MERLMHRLCLACALVLLPTSATAAGPEEGARASFERSHAKVSDLVDAGASATTIAREVDALLDYASIAQAALGGPSHYEARCGDQCDAFEDLLTRLIRANYLERITDERGALEVVGAEVRERATKVRTRVRFELEGRQQMLSIDYVMHEQDDRWKVRDIITEDVSLARTYRYEIHELYKRGGMDLVLSTLEAKL